MKCAWLGLPIFGVGLGALAVWWGWPLESPRFASPHDPGPRAVPFLAAAACAVFSVLAGIGDQRKGADAAVPESASAGGHRVPPLIATASSLGIVSAYVGLIPWMGFYGATGIFSGIFSRLSGASWRIAVVVGVVLPLAVYLVFERGLQAALPRSFLGR